MAANWEIERFQNTQLQQDQVLIVDIVELRERIKQGIASGMLKEGYDLINKIEEIYKLIKNLKRGELLKVVKTFRRELTFQGIVKASLGKNGRVVFAIKGKLKLAFSAILKVQKVYYLTFPLVSSGLKKVVKQSNIILTMLVNSSFVFTEHFAKDVWDWSDFFSDLAVNTVVDLTTVFISAGTGKIAFLAASKVASVCIAGSSVPALVGVLAVGVVIVTTYWMGEYIDRFIQEHQIKERVSEQLDSFYKSLNAGYSKSIDAVNEILIEAEREIYHLYGRSPKLIHY